MKHRIPCFALLLALEAATLAAWFSGASSAAIWHINGRAFELCGLGPVEWRTEPLGHRVDGRSYVVALWCTPTCLWCGGFFVLWAGATRPKRLLLGALILAVGSLAALTVNIVFSVWIHPHVWTWNWGHIPGTVLVYVSAFVFCLWWADRQRRGRHATQHAAIA